MSLENNELLILDTLVYYANISNKIIFGNEKIGDNNEEIYISVGEFIKDIKKYKDDYNTVFDGLLGYTDEDLGMDKIIELIDSNDKLKSLVMVYPDTEEDKTTSSVCFVAPETSEVYVIYVGNYNNDPYKYYMKEDGFIDISSWVENIMGAVEADTDEQKRNLDFYSEAIQAARDYIKNQEGDLNITVSGHSTGGNNAQYVTIAYNENNKYLTNEKGESDYKAIKDIDKCVSFDGQGFSQAFLENYSDAIEKCADKITSYCPNISIVGALMNDIPGIEQKYIDIGKTNAKIIGCHMPTEMLDENGNFEVEGAPSVEYLLLKFYIYSTSSIELLGKFTVGRILICMQDYGKYTNI